MTERRVEGYIGRSFTVRGRLEGAGNLAIEGTFEGEMELEGEVTLLDPGRIRGLVAVTTLVVEGRLRGDVRAHEVVVHEGGQIEGDLHASHVSIDDGAIVRGSVIMDFEPPDVSAVGSTDSARAKPTRGGAA